MPTLPSRSPVTEIPALSSADALRHFSRLLELETDCWDVHASLESGGFVLLDVRSAELFRRGHARGAVSLPHARITARALEQYPPETLFVRGSLAALDRPRVGIVGTRRCTLTGSGVARQLGRELAANGVAIFSAVAGSIPGSLSVENGGGCVSSMPAG